ncbi:PadR family transcriptional regulator [Actinomadura rupiterrae]|uniref:PadR family transcriptional regulator n=1 Tax=Actinomadura rupiterrae TaxID=559627 RepID=UPI0020A5820E|nr:PadR family transcriptional regulator [Actinomadura rupiterrae]MCP2336033.1 DNA-binding PadR family transcriptional regulator [Actinomadura rupiterrae]
MSLRHGLLGLLAEGPASGYDLARRFEEHLGPVWPAQHPKIYAELSRLSKAGMIEVDSHGPRGRKAYRITDAGRAEVRRWLSEDAVDHTLRSESVLRSFFFWLMDPDDLHEHLRREQRYFTEIADLARGYAAAKDRGEYGTAPQTKSMRVALEAAIRVYQSLADWAEWAQTVPPATPEEDADTPRPPTPA